MNRILKISMFPGMLLIIVATTLFLKGGIGGARAASSQTCGTWSIESSPNPSTTGNSFSGVAANSANDIWAVGSYESRSKPYVLIEHWNGSSWSISPSPNTGENSWLQGVVASSATNAWAVGTYSDSSGASRALIEQWNGTSWNIVANPNVPGSSSDSLYAVTSFSASNVWAVGYYRSGSGIGQTLVEHWDGTSWSVVPSPNPGADYDTLSSVARVKGTTQVWAVGSDVNSNNDEQTLIERWNGTSWKVIASPNLGSEENFLSGVSAISASDIWAVGDDFNISLGSTQTLTEQWNGTSWSVVSSPNDGANSNGLNGVSSISRTGAVWAVGGYTTSHGHRHGLTEFYC